MHTKLSTILLIVLYILSVFTTLYTIVKSPINSIADVLVILTLVVYSSYFLLVKKLSFKILVKNNSIFFTYLSLLVFINTVFNVQDLNKYSILLAYIISSVLTFVVIGNIILIYDSVFKNFMYVLFYSSVFFSLMAILANLGVKNFLGLEMANKFGAYQLFGFHGTGGILEHPNTLGSQLVLGSIAGFYLKDLTRNNILYWSLICIVLMGLFLSFVRGPILSLSLGYLGFFFYKNIIDNKAKILFQIIALVPIIYLFFLLVPDDILLTYFRIDRGLSGREIMWPFAFLMIQNNPWLGYGFKSSSAVKMTYGNELIQKYAPEAAYHNSIITSAVESGVIVAFFYLLIFLLAIYRPLVSEMDFKKRRILFFFSTSIFLSVMTVDYNIGGVRTVPLIMSILLGASFGSIKKLYKNV